LKHAAPRRVSAAGRILASCFATLAVSSALAHGSRDTERLPVIGPAPQFTLTRETGEPFSSRELRGKVAAVTFIYATCTDSCPVLTSRLVAVQRKLGADFGAKVRFVAITVDPTADTPEVLRRYASAHGADPRGWSFLTGSPAAIGTVVRDFGAFARKNPRGDVDHLYITSLIDRRGEMRVQYLGYRFDPDEMLRDLKSLLGE
jgi:protein SCO1/2